MEVIAQRLEEIVDSLRPLEVDWLLLSTPIGPL
jgi:hypothetical protein